MKKICIILAALFTLLSLSACSATDDEVVSALPKYDSMAAYSSGDFQDYTDYAKYSYHSVDENTLTETGYFKKIADADISDICDYIDNFEQWVENCGGELLEKYDFDRSNISAGDYFHLITKAGQPIGEGTYDKFDDYSLYYFDMDAQTLYYFHSNI